MTDREWVARAGLLLFINGLGALSLGSQSEWVGLEMPLRIRYALILCGGLGTLYGIYVVYASYGPCVS